MPVTDSPDPQASGTTDAIRSLTADTSSADPVPLGRGNPYAGISVVVMAIGLTVSLSASLVLAVIQTTPISQQLAGVLSTLGGAVMGSIATYLGVRGRQE